MPKEEKEYISDRLAKAIHQALEPEKPKKPKVDWFIVYSALAAAVFVAIVYFKN